MKRIRTLLLMTFYLAGPGIGTTSSPPQEKVRDDLLQVGGPLLTMIDIDIGGIPLAQSIASRFAIKPIKAGRHYLLVVEGYDFQELWRADLSDVERESLRLEIDAILIYAPVPRPSFEGLVSRFNP